LALQYATVEAGGDFAALHPVNVMLMFRVSTLLAGQSWRILTPMTEKETAS
jgi:hypothetical protein